jgi:cytochrome c peroxidase
MSAVWRLSRFAAVAAVVAAATSALPGPAPANPPTKPSLAGLTEPADYLLPNESLMIPFKDQVPMAFVTRNQPEWGGLKAFLTDGKEDAVDPATGEKVARRVVKVKVPLGLNQAPPVPAENPMTLARWVLGRKLYYDPILSTSGDVACATCHSPKKGFTDQRRTSTGIRGAIGPINSPTIMNAAYNKFQFWDGRADTLEDQSQGPVGNAKEMFGGKADPWEEAILRLRAAPDYVKAFAQVFGHAPTRDSAAKAIATYERTVLSGNAVQDRAEAAMKKRVTEEESGKFELKAEDYAEVLKAAFAAKDAPAIEALKLDPTADAGKVGDMAKRLLNGRTLFFGKARCALCHTGDTYSDGQFHNLGVGADKNGDVPYEEFGRFDVLRTGHKDVNLVGAFKTPGLRGLVHTAPYMHSGDEKTLEAVVDLYDRGGNVNPYLSDKLRDTTAEAAYVRARNAGQPVDPAVKTFGPSRKPIIPLKLNLSAAEKADLVLFLRGLAGDPIDPVVADPLVEVK